jgi:RNA polymerase sigma-70 factor (ECF subfamily)
MRAANNDSTTPETLDHNETGSRTEADLNRYVLSRLKSGDEEAFQYFFLRLKTPLFHFIRRMIGSVSDAEDICQETFTTLWLKRESVDEEGNIKSFLFGIAKYLVWNHMRTAKRREFIFNEAGFDINEGISPEIIMQLKETELLAEYAISKLPTRTRQIYRLHYYDNLSNEQIARSLEISPENIRTHLYLARKTIREIIIMAILAGLLVPR